MNDRPEFQAVFHGAPNDKDGTVRRIPLVRDEKTWEWVQPLEIVTEQVYFDGTPPRRTGRYVRVRSLVYRWEPES